MRRHVILGASLIAAVLLSVRTTGANVVDVFAQEFEFVPREVGVAPGDSVRWTNVMLATHTVTSGTGSSDPLAGDLFDVVLPATAQFAFQFDSLGTYPYFCRPHEAMDMRGTVVVSGFPAGVESSVPVSPTLVPVWPNPAGGGATFGFGLGRAAHAKLEIFDALGRRIAVIHEAETGAGFHRREWDGRDDSGREVPSGVYLVRLTAAGESESRRFVRLK